VIIGIRAGRHHPVADRLTTPGTEHKPVKGRRRLPARTGAAHRDSCPGISIGFESAVYTALVIAGKLCSARFLLGARLGDRRAVLRWRWPVPACSPRVGVIVAMATFAR